MRIAPNLEGPGARVEGAGPSQPLSPGGFRAIIRALGGRGVLCFPGRSLDAPRLSAFGSRFGRLERNVADGFHVPGHPGVMVLSNVEKGGKPVGPDDAGRGRHTDMSHSQETALADVPHAKRAPERDGRPPSDTRFHDMRAACEGLPADARERPEGRSAAHDVEKFWEMARLRPGSGRAPLTGERRRRKPPVPRPIFRVRPVTGRRVLCRNPGYAVRIEGMEPVEGGAMLELPVPAPVAGRVPPFAQMDAGRRADAGQYRHHAQRGGHDGPDEPRHTLRVQAVATLDHARLAA